MVKSPQTGDCGQSKSSDRPEKDSASIYLSVGSGDAKTQLGQPILGDKRRQERFRVRNRDWRQRQNAFEGQADFRQGDGIRRSPRIGVGFAQGRIERHPLASTESQNAGVAP